MATRGNRRNDTGIPARVRRPDPPPFQTNDVRVVSIGTASWLVALLALLPFREQLSEQGKGWWMWTCLAGFGLGLWGITYCRRRAHRLAQQAPADPAPHLPAADRTEERADPADLADPADAEETRVYPPVAERQEGYGDSEHAGPPHPDSTYPEPGYLEPGYLEPDHPARGYPEQRYGDPNYAEAGYEDLGPPETGYYEGPHTDPGLPHLPEPHIHDSAYETGYHPAYDPSYETGYHPAYDPAYDPAYETGQHQAYEFGHEQPSDPYSSDVYTGEQPYPGYPPHDPYASYGVDTGQHTAVFPYPPEEQGDPAHGYPDHDQWRYHPYEDHTGYPSQEQPAVAEDPFPTHPYGDPYGESYEPPVPPTRDPPPWEAQESAWWRD
ncbi:MAG: DUF2530 domain-containing protein [Carbonactinosporaceae bacterium]